MTVAATTRKAGPFVGNGVTTSFPFTFKVFSTADIVATLQVVATGVESTLVLDTDYTVTLNGDQNASPGGSVTYNPSGTPMASTHTLTLTSAVAQSQTLALTNGGGFFPTTLNAAFDRAVILIQQIAEKLGRGIRGPVSDSTAMNELPAAAERASKFLAFDEDGQPIASSGGIDPSVPVSAFGETLIDDANAAAARTTLELGTMATQAASAVAITGGTMAGAAINSTTVGATTPAAVTATTLTSTGNTTLGDAAADTLTVNAETVSQPNIPAFSAHMSASVNNVTGAGTTYTIIADTENFDQSGDYNNATGIFTAPAAGRYLFTGHTRIGDLTAAMTLRQLILSTSNRNYINSNSFAPAASSAEYLQISHIVDMDAGDTARLQVVASNGAGDTADLLGSSTAHTSFSGARIA